MKRVAIVIRRGPDHGLGMREMIDMALVFAVFECHVTLILQEEGVFWVELPDLPSGNPSSLTGKLKSLAMYDIEEIIIHRESLEEFPFLKQRLSARIESTNDINLRCRNFDVILEA